jgi:hypothetical protein
MRLFHYSSADGAFIAEGEAVGDPMQPGRWLLPAWSTLDVPPAPVAGKVAHYLIPGTDTAPATQYGQTGAWELRDQVEGS